MSELTNKVALVTGASSGFGVGIAKALAASGCKVWVTARNIRKLEQTAAEIGATPLQADATNPADWDRVIDHIMADAGQLDILVNNAGGALKIAPITEFSDEAMAEVINVNLISAMMGSKRAAAVMKARQSGTIINISSICAQQAWTGWGIYAAAKAGLDQFTRSLYVEMRPFNVRATALIPSWGATDFNRNAQLEHPLPEVAARMISPEQIGKLVVQICSLDANLVVPELTVLPLIQEIEPY